MGLQVSGLAQRAAFPTVPDTVFKTLDLDEGLFCSVILCVFLIFGIGSGYIPQAGLELKILLPP